MGEFVVLIDAGHGAQDSGAVALNGLLEKNINLKVSLYLKDLLRNNGNFKVVMTREGDTYPSFNERASKGNIYIAPII
jgi:N-acetylmuramoyl-L-alanine amidase